MKNPVNIAKKGYNKILKIDDLANRLNQIEEKQENILQQLSTIQNHLQTQLPTQLESQYQTQLDNATAATHDKIDSIASIIKYTTDITKIPKASGLERTIQKANFILYKEIAKILKANNITFFVDFGILIGLVRHNDFIPWDDDIDISVPRTDYEILPRIFKTAFKESGLKFVESEITRIYYKDTPLQLDIFPIDFSDNQLDNTGKLALKKKIIEYQSSIQFDWQKLLSQQSVIISPTIKELRSIYHQTIYKRDLDLATAKQHKSSIIHSPESPRGDRTYILDYDDIFPLQKANFMGTTIPVPHNIHQLLAKYYGDYFSIPNDLGKKHEDIKSRINTVTIEEVNDIVEAKGFIK